MATRGASLKMVKEIHAVFDPFGSSGVTIVRYVAFQNQGLFIYALINRKVFLNNRIISLCFLLFSLREFLRRVSSQKLMESNPKFKLSSEVKCDQSEPFIKITYGRFFSVLYLFRNTVLKKISLNLALMLMSKLT